jgi:hypothetical protein
MIDPRWQAFEGTCRDLVSETRGVLSWSWDGRLGAALATLRGAEGDAVTTIVARHLGSTWDHATLGGAPKPIRELAANLGGVRAGQWLRSSDPGAGVLVAAVWWPWGDGKTVSLRVFPVSNGPTSPSFEGLIASFRGWFGA